MFILLTISFLYLCVSFSGIENIILLNNRIKNIINSIKTKTMSQCINIGYLFIFTYSFLQIKVNKINNSIITIINPFMTIIQNFLGDNNKYNELKAFDNDGNMILSKQIDRPNYIENINNEIADVNYQTIHFNDVNSDEYVNVVTFDKMPDSFDYQKSNVNFIMMELKVNNLTYVIDLKNNKFNYYIVNNSFNTAFYKYYLKNVLNIEIDTNFDYNVNILDNNANMINLTPNQHIVLQENDYSIYTNDLNLKNVTFETANDNNIKNRISSNDYENAIHSNNDDEDSEDINNTWNDGGNDTENSTDDDGDADDDGDDDDGDNGNEIEDNTNNHNEKRNTDSNDSDKSYHFV